MLDPLVEAWLSPVVSVFAVPQLYPYPADKPKDVLSKMVFEVTFQIVLKTLNNQPGDFVSELPLLIPAFIPKFTEWVLEMVLLTLLKLERVSDSLWVESSLVPSLNW